MSACVICGEPATTVDGVAHVRCERCLRLRPGFRPLAADALQTILPPDLCAVCNLPGAQRVEINGVALLKLLCDVCAENAGADQASLESFPGYRLRVKIRQNQERREKESKE